MNNNTLDRPMTLWEIQNQIGELHAELCILKETSNAIEAGVNQEILKAENIGWALIGLRDGIEKLCEKTEELQENSWDTFRLLTGISEMK